jgi:hypothetical protein
MGGTDDEDNLTPPISIEMHAEFHKMLWLDYGHKEDYIAWKCLSGRITNERARLMAAKLGQDKSSLYKESRKTTGEMLKNSVTKESRSKGGKTASKKLIEWQKNNKEDFLKRCSEIGKASTERKKIPHKYLGVIYSSKKELQEAHNMSICGFYGKLRRGEIERIENV